MGRFHSLLAFFRVLLLIPMASFVLFRYSFVQFFYNFFNTSRVQLTITKLCDACETNMDEMLNMITLYH
jgi:hypothetical protein